ncbi:MAG: 50S ribosomal protein L9 [Candidatus Omnitrophica bacterium]|nr:50S ribosomal protein L9 [Candidatus Omnitrophota bacterium]
MDVILLRDVEQLGTEGATVRVKPGYARNFLLPRKLAVAATPEAVKTVEEITRQRARKLKQQQAEAEALKQRLEQQALSFTLSLGEDGKAFGSITLHDVLDALSRAGVAVEKHAIQLPQPIKSLGLHEVPVKVHRDMVAVLKVRVVKA